MIKKSTIPVNGGAMPKFDRRAIMARAWAIFRETYHYPRIRFASIGRPCFAWALRKAWAEYKKARAVAAIPAADKASRIEILQQQIKRARFGAATGHV